MKVCNEYGLYKVFSNDYLAHMGLIERQGIKQSIVSYTGIAVGALSSIFLYPIVMREYGIVQFILTVATLFVPFTMFGTTQIIIKFFPEFENEEKGHNGILTITSLIVFAGFLLYVLFFLFGRSVILEYFSNTPEWQKKFIDFSVPLVFFIGWSNLLKHYIHNFKRIVIPSIFDNLIPKIVLPLLILLLFFEIITLQVLLWSVLIMWFLIVVAQLSYIHHLGQFFFPINFDLLTKERTERMAKFGLYGFLGGWGYVLISRADILMVGLLTDDPVLVTVYTFSVFICEFIDVPRKAITQITSPLISKAWNAKDLQYLDDLYQKSSLVQYIVATGLFLIAWFCVGDLFKIMKNGEVYSAEVMTVCYLGLARVVDMLTGVNGSIIALSKYYKYNLIFLIIMAFVNIGLNYLLIPMFGIPGAALATLISTVLFNTMKYSFLLLKYQLNPFSKETLISTVTAIVTYILALIIPFTGIPFLDLILKAVFISLIFGSLIYLFKVSPEINQSIDKYIGSIISLVKK